MRKKTAETVRAQFAEMEAARGLKKSRSAGNLQAAAEDDESGSAAAPPSSRLSRLALGSSLKKAIRATRDNIIGTSRASTSDEQQQPTGRETVSGGSPLRSPRNANHSTASSGTAANGNNGSSDASSASVSAGQSHTNSSFSSSSGHTTNTGGSSSSSASGGGSSAGTGNKKSGMECIPS